MSINLTPHDLHQQIEEVQQKFLALGTHLATMIQDLQERGIPPTETAERQLIQTRRQFMDLRENALALALLTEVNPPPLPTELSTLDDIRHLLETIEALQSKTSDQSRTQQALDILDRVLSLQHREQARFEPLYQCQAKARYLKGQIQDSIGAEPSDRIQAIVAGEHPFVALLALVEQDHHLTDDQWESFHSKVSQAYGQGLATAISRGKIILGSENSVPLSSSTPSPQGTSASPTSPTVKPSQIIGVTMKIRIENLGDYTIRPGEMTNIPAGELRLQGFHLLIEPAIPGLGLRYMAHLSGGDTDWVKEGEFVGAPDLSQQIEGFAIELTGSEASNYDIFYVGYLDNLGETPLLFNGQFCGTRDRGIRLEGMKVWIQKK